MQRPVPQAAWEITRINYQRCIGCGRCRAGCPLLSEVYENPKKLLQSMVQSRHYDAQWPYACMLCGYCEEVCPKKVRFKEMFWQYRLQSSRELRSLPGTRALRFHQALSFSGPYRATLRPRVQGVAFFPGCAFRANSPQIVRESHRYLKKIWPDCQMDSDCCAKPTLQMGDIQGFEKKIGEVSARLQQAGITTLITACQNCYNTLSDHLPGLEIYSLWEVVAAHGLPSGAKPKEFSGRIVLHDPCPTRNFPAIQESARVILQDLAVPFEEMPHCREETLCCGSGGMAALLAPKFSNKHRQRRAKESSADVILTYCQECVEAMRRAGKPSWHIADLLFLEGPLEQRPTQSTPMKWLNRLQARR